MKYFFFVLLLFRSSLSVVEFPVTFGIYKKQNPKAPIHDNIPIIVPTIKFCVSLQNQCFNVSIDTNIFQLWIPGQELSSVFNNTYSITQDDTKDQDTSTALFDYGYFNGDFYHVYTSPFYKQNLTKFPVSIMNKGNINYHVNFVNGKIGILRLNFQNERNKKYSYLHFLAKSNIIKEEILNIEYKDFQSGRVSFGERNDKLSYCPLTTSRYQLSWSCSLNYIIYQNNSLELEEKEQFILFNSFLQYVFAPGETGGFILKKMIQGHEKECEIVCEGLNKFIKCDKNTNIKSFSPIHLSTKTNFTLTLYPQDLFSLTSNGSEYVSKLLVISNENSLWTIGIPGFNNKILSFDQENFRVGIADLKKRTLFSTKLFYLISAFLFLISFFVAFFFIRRSYIRKKLNRKSEINFSLMK